MIYCKRNFSVFLPRLYANACALKGESYHNFEDLKVNWGRQDDYEILENIGRGKYSEVFRGVNILNNEQVVIKVLKPIKSHRVAREVKILQNLNGKYNVPKLCDIVKDYGSQTPSLILEYCKNDDLNKTSKKMSDFELRYYVYEILRALDYSHSNGIMHRDVKPGNIMVDHANRKVRLIDWGLAEFYFPKKQYSVRVASRYFKGPELLVGYETYDYSLDMWSLGASLAAIIFSKEPFFYGEDNNEVLLQIIQTLGSDDFIEYTKKYKILIDEKIERKVLGHKKVQFNKLINQHTKHFANLEALDFVSGLLVFDHHLRYLPKEAMKHKYFDEVREMWEDIKSNKNITNDAYKKTAEIIKRNLDRIT